MRPSPLLLRLAAGLLLLGAGCRVEPVDPTSATTVEARITGDRATDEATLRRLEADAVALARTAGCATAGQCRSMPVGAKACGGPRYYLAYCPLTTDEPALARQLSLLESFERTFNERYGIFSTCDFASPPALELAGGACRAAAR